MPARKTLVKFSRRNMLQFMGFGAAGAYLAACAPAATPAATATALPAATATTAPATVAAVTNAKWSISGNYFESCSCDYICPCISQPDGKPTQGYCAFGMAFHIDQGHYGSTALGGLNVAVVGRSPEEMGKGNWSVGTIVDALAAPEQQTALAAIFGGTEGGPMGAIAPIVGTYLGVAVKPINFDKKGMNRSVLIPGLLDQAIDGVALGASITTRFRMNTRLRL